MNTRMDRCRAELRIPEATVVLFDAVRGGGRRNGYSSYEPLYLEKLQRNGSDLPLRLADLLALLLNCVGRAVEVIVQPLGANGLPDGGPLVYSGGIERVEPALTDSNSQEMAVLKVEVKPYKIEAWAE